MKTIVYYLGLLLLIICLSLKGTAQIEGFYYKSDLKTYNKSDDSSVFEKNNKAIQTKPTATAYFERGRIYIHRGRFNNAIDDFTNAISLPSESVKTAIYFTYRGDCKYYLKEYTEAIEDYSKAIETNKEYGIAYYGRGLVFHLTSEFKKAIDDYSKAIPLTKNDTSRLVALYSNRANCQIYTKDYTSVVEDCNKAIELNSTDGYAYWNRAFGFERLNQFQNAIDDFTKAILLCDNKNRSSIYTSRSFCKINIKDNYGTIEDCDKAIEIDNHNGTAYYWRSMALGNLKELKKALNDMTEAISLYKDDNKFISNMYYNNSSFKK